MNRYSVSVCLDGAACSFDKCYSYFVPENIIKKARPGCRVTVPFGNGNITKQGLIFSSSEIEDNPKIKYILSVNDDEPIINDEILALCEFMKERLFCTYYDVINTILPAGLKNRLENFFAVNEEFSVYSLLKEEEKQVFDYIKANPNVSGKKIKALVKDNEEILYSLLEKEAVICEKASIRNLSDKTLKYIRLVNDEADFGILTPRQREIAEVIRTAGSVSVKEVIYFTGVTVPVINSIVKKGVAEYFEKQVFRIPYKKSEKIDTKTIELNEEQNRAYNELSKRLKENKENISLLYGVTGSGKTSVYMKLVDDCVNQNKGVIVMVPEIALTPQMIELFSSRYGDKIAVFHSNMSLGQRMDEYNRVRIGKATIVIGTRSAVFAPLEKLGLIIIDEEQEHTYKSEKSPKFNARDIAKFRANYHKCLCVLSSATPSLESYSNALSGKYGLCELNKRYGDAKLPNVLLVDMKKELNDGNKSNISRLLASEIEKSLQDKKQVILLLNRRGHNTYISCPNCGYVATCNDCSVSLTYHSANKRLMCHYCGHSEPLPQKCPECGNEYLCFNGAGTQKLAEETALLFPNAKILRLDADTTLARDSYSVSLKAFADKEYDILIGTQMVAKGLDFPDVNLVGVIGADRAFYSDDFRGFERTFSLLTQVVGRAGRSGGESRAVIQTFNTDDNVISLASKQDYKSFYEEEILTRKLMIYPPFCDICLVVVSSEDKQSASEAITEIFSNIKEKTGKEYGDIKLIILGPMPASVIKVNGRYRYRMIIKCKNNKKFRSLLRESTAIKYKKDTNVSIDINPETII